MPDPLAENGVRLEQLLERMKTEKNLRKADAIVKEIWEVLAERNRLKKELATRKKSA